MMEQRELGQSIIDFTDNVDVPETLLTDKAGDFTGRNTEFVEHARRMRMQLHNLEQGRQNKNHASEREIWFLAKHWRRQTTKKMILKRLWYFGLVYKAELFSRMPGGKGKRTEYEEVTGQTPDIGEYLYFEF